MTLALLSLVAGGLLSQRFAVFILWPAISAMGFLVLILIPLFGIAAAAGLTIFALSATALQLGYLAGALAKARFGATGPALA